MSSLLVPALMGGIACLALLCCLLGLGQTIRQQRAFLARPSSSLDACASAICSACHGHLSGLESHCPTCGKRMRYQVPGGPSAPRLEPTPHARKAARSQGARRGKDEEPVAL